MNNYAPAIKQLLENEGGYVNDPSDPGGETNFGICKRDNPDLDIKNLTKEFASDWYHKHYWLKYGFHLINDDRLARWLFNHVVNCGEHPVIKCIQTALQTILHRANRFDISITIDGVIGPQTIKLINEWYKTTDLLMVENNLWNHYEQLMQKNPKLEKYRNGWHARCYQN